ncbi:MAG: phospholipid carrier-dependent glycosyltransferase, partial [Gemmatimonadaceae bacterium]
MTLLESTSDSPTKARRPHLRVAFALWIALFGMLPIANWIAGGHDSPWYGQVAFEWLSGSAIALGVGLVAAILSRRLPLWRDGLGTRIAEVAASHRHRTAGVIGTAAFLTYACVAVFVFDRRALHIDELAQVVQARIFARGVTSLGAPPHPEFFSMLHVVDFGGRWYSQFPPGGPAMLLPGVVVGAVWLVGPVCGALAAAAFWYLMPRLDQRPSVALGATLVFAFSPFMVFMSGSQMNHVPALLWSVLSLLALAQATERASGSWQAALWLGFCLGMIASIRPVDGAALALPAGCWLLWRAYKTPALLRDLLMAGIGVAVPIACVLAFNASTTGNPFLFGYELLWGKSHALGFHRAPWGFAHTPARGVELLNLYFLRLQSYLFETPFPALLPAIGALVLGRVTSHLDRVLLWSGALLLLGYFAYWHDGFYLGPRFLFPLLPVLALWSARFLAEVRRVTGPGAFPVRVTAFTLLTGAIIALTVSVPFRVRQYAGGLTSMRLDYTGPAARAGVLNSLILVRESWGAQLVARLWALGVPRSETELLYRSVDACLLEQNIRQLEHSGVRDSSALGALMPLLRDSARVEKSDLSPDRTERMVPGTFYPPM